MGVEIQHEFVYPLEDAFAVYLSDYFDNSLFVIQGILEYDECIAVLTGTKNLPSEIHSALMRRGKEANGGKTTLALAMAGIQNIVNE